MGLSDSFSWALAKAPDTSWQYWLVAIAFFVPFAFLILQLPSMSVPRTLNDPVPHVYNTLQFMFHNHKFMARAQKQLQTNTLLRFYLGPRTVYLVVGPKGIRQMFGRDMVHQITNQDQMTQYALPTLYRMNRSEIRRWEDDKSGVTKVPIRGTERTPTRQRLWYMYEHIYSEYLGKTHMKPLVDIFQHNLSQTLQRFSTDEWMTVSVQEVCRRDVTESAINALFSTDLIKLTPDFIDRFWDFDKHVFMLVLGLPKWMNPTPFQAHDRYIRAIQKWLDVASAGFDWEGPDSEMDWEPRFGGRAPRELVKWMTETGWRKEVIAATLGALVFALNSNSIPTTTWMLMEIFQDPTLLRNVRDEVNTALITNTESGPRIIDNQKLLTLPLLQSILTETLRLRINFNITRDVKQPVTLDGQTIPKGSLLQAPMQFAHFSEAIWGTQGHPATEFWAERHIHHTDETERVYAMAGNPTYYFPFGGGANMCPGRQLAKSEILTTVAIMVTQFDIEYVRWTHPDGSPSDRAAESDVRYSGAGAMPPERDMVIRWKWRR